MQNCTAILDISLAVFNDGKCAQTILAIWLLGSYWREMKAYVNINLHT